MELKFVKLVRPEHLSLKAMSAVPRESENPTIQELIANVEQDINFTKTAEWQKSVNDYLMQHPSIPQICWELQTEDERQNHKKIAAVEACAKAIIIEENMHDQCPVIEDGEDGDVQQEGQPAGFAQKNIKIFNDKGEEIVVPIHHVLITPQILQSFIELLENVPAHDMKQIQLTEQALQVVAMEFVDQHPELDKFLTGMLYVSQDIEPNFEDLRARKCPALVNEYNERAIDDISRRAADIYEIIVSRVMGARTQQAKKPDPEISSTL